jgi:hypothetical protein
LYFFQVQDKYFNWIIIGLMQEIPPSFLPLPEKAFCLNASSPCSGKKEVVLLKINEKVFPLLIPA